MEVESAVISHARVRSRPEGVYTGAQWYVFRTCGPADLAGESLLLGSADLNAVELDILVDDGRLPVCCKVLMVAGEWSAISACLSRLVDLIGVSDLSQLVGARVRVRREGGLIRAIGGTESERWFVPADKLGLMP
jgi:hypothetical protein